MKNILLIGLGRFGRHIALQLSKLGHEVMAVDINEERVNESLTIVTNAQIGDSKNTEFLRSLGIGNFDVCIVTIGGNFQNSLETTSLRNGADEVIYPEKQVANWAAIRYTADHIRDYIEVDEGHAIFEVEVPEGWIGKTVGELDIRRKYSINIMATKENGKINMAVSPETVLTDKITLLVLGAYKELQKCFRI